MDALNTRQLQTDIVKAILGHCDTTGDWPKITTDNGAEILGVLASIVGAFVCDMMQAEDADEAEAMLISAFTFRVLASIRKRQELWAQDKVTLN